MSIPTADRIHYILEVMKRLRDHLHSQVFGENGPSEILEALSPVQLQVAMCVDQQGQLSLGELASHLKVSAPSVSVTVERLVEKQILTRETDPRDRRRVLIGIHPQAQGEMRALRERFEKEFRTFAGKVGRATVDQWFLVMQQVESVMDQEVEETR